MMDEAAAREIDRLKDENDRLHRLVSNITASAAMAQSESDLQLLTAYAMLEESERQRKQLSEHIETLARGGIEAATGAGK